MHKTNIRNIFARILLSVGLAFFGLLGFGSNLSAQSLNQGYTADQPLELGMLVKEKDSDHSKVEPVSQNTLAYLKGVVVNRNDSAVVISSEGQNVFVADSGTHEVLVSDENGNIKKGDYLSISSIDGIAMKADNNVSIVLGRAAENFNGVSDNIGSTTRKSDNKKVNLGKIQTDIAIATSPIKKQPARDTVPKIFKDVSSSVAGKTVSTGRIWLASIIFLASSMVTGIMLYGGARSSLIALGRNPLSKKSIIRGLIQVVIMGMIVFICGMFGVYLLLKL